jgi:hypothetical protein
MKLFSNDIQFVLSGFKICTDRSPEGRVPDQQVSLGIHGKNRRPRSGLQEDAKALRIYVAALKKSSGCSGPFRQIREWLHDSFVGN